MTAKVVPLKRAASWDAVREGYSRMQQMGYQSVEQAARVGQMLTELRGDPNQRGDFLVKARRALGSPNEEAASVQASVLMRIAAHWSKLAKHKPDSLRAALALIPKKKRAVVEDDPDTDVVTDPGPPDEDDDIKPTPEDFREGFMTRVNSAREWAKFPYPEKCPVDKGMVESARACAKAWMELAQQLEKRL